ncbi:uncharacterized protein LOC6050204 [Culex quinquefasciatus]|uniref:uncharacterized protein LOC6050204 n=1 Tax=Culex quinquefasciatus TaxID=7176 RepID=UPI0018E39C1D|nr:uncharacterized protein LOC6050204 [Culex quinquefasciatus]
MATVSELVNRMTLSEPELHLPPELWELIFAHLAGKRVLVMRLVCHRWKTIVDRKRSLWNTLSVCVRYSTTNERFHPESLPPVTGFCVNWSTIEDVDCWWPSFGERLTRIKLGYGSVTLNLVVGMLRHTPNLTHLHLSRFRETSEEEPVVDFQLERMEELYLEYSICDAFVETFPRLRNLKMDLNEGYQEITARLMNFVQGTLEELDFKATPYLMKEIAKMERLKLKTLRFKGGCEFAVQLSRIQPSLEKIFLILKASTPDFCEIGKNLPDLKQLSVLIDRQGLLEPSFLANMSQLQKLSLENYLFTMQLNFGPLKCPNLVELKLNQFHLVANSLPTFLAGSKNLQKLSLDSCVLESLLELFTTLVELPSLRHLELKYLRMLNNDFNISTFQLTTNLESLHLSDCENLTNKMVDWLATSSCRMKEVRLYRMPQVNDATIRNMCVKLPRLKKLALLICSVMITSAEYIVEHAHSLEYLELNGCFEFRQAMEQLLKGHHRYIECKFP